VVLSQARADTVRAFLAARLASPARLSSAGRGDPEPIAPNDTPQDRAKNRRVDIVILSPGAAS
jgi:type VI secretion system protein ImpK